MQRQWCSINGVRSSKGDFAVLKHMPETGLLEDMILVSIMILKGFSSSDRLTVSVDTVTESSSSPWGLEDIIAAYNDLRRVMSSDRVSGLRCRCL